MAEHEFCKLVLKANEKCLSPNILGGRNRTCLLRAYAIHWEHGGAFGPALGGARGRRRRTSAGEANTTSSGSPML